MEKIDELDAPPKIGRYYLVPSGLTEYFGFRTERKTWWPLRGPSHKDPPLRADFYHIHLDVRFLTKRQLHTVKQLYIFMSPGIYIENRDAPYNTTLPTDELLRLDYRPMLCKRLDRRKNTPSAELIAKILYKTRPNMRMKKLKCPHKGYDLRTVPEIKGCRTCPLHNLQFDDEGNVVNESVKLENAMQYWKMNGFGA